MDINSYSYRVRLAQQIEVSLIFAWGLTSYMYSGNSSCGTLLAHIGCALLITTAILHVFAFMVAIHEIDSPGRPHPHREVRNYWMLAGANLFLSIGFGFAATEIFISGPTKKDLFTPFRYSPTSYSSASLMIGMFILFVWGNYNLVLRAVEAHNNIPVDERYWGTPVYWIWEIFGVFLTGVSLGLMCFGAAPINPNNRFVLFIVFSSIAAIAPVATFIQNATSNETKAFYSPCGLCQN